MGFNLRIFILFPIRPVMQVALIIPIFYICCCCGAADTEVPLLLMCVRP